MAEYYGHAWQTCSVSCDQKGSNPHCDQAVGLDTDSDRIGSACQVLEGAIQAAWNAAAAVMTVSGELALPAQPGKKPPALARTAAAE